MNQKWSDMNQNWLESIRIYLKINQPRAENIPLQQEDKDSNVIKILRGSDKVAIEDLIVNAKDDERNM